MLHTTPRRAVALSLPKRLPAKTRQQVDEAIERLQTAQLALIAFLDAADGDADLEPSLGFQDPAVGNIDQEHIARCSHAADLEEDVQDEPHDPEPDERDLGWPAWPNQDAALKASHGDYRNGDWWDNRDTDREGDPSEREPSLGARHCVGMLTGSENRGFDQTGWADGGTDDREGERYEP